jgi:hypothetical protein
MKEVESLLKDSAVKTGNYIRYLLWAMFGTMKRNNSISGVSKRKYTSVYTLYKDGNEDNVCTLYLQDIQQINGGKITNILKKKFKQELKLWMKEEGILLTKDKSNGRFHYNDTVGYFIMHSVLRLYSIR